MFYATPLATNKIYLKFNYMIGLIFVKLMNLFDDFIQKNIQAIYNALWQNIHEKIFSKKVQE